MNASAYLFDLDGTLVDSLDDLQQAVNHVLRRFDRPPLGRETVRTYVGDGLRVLLARSFLGKESPTDGDPVARESEGLVPLPAAERARRRAIASLLERAAILDGPSMEEARRVFTAFYLEHLTDHTRCYPGVEHALERLRSTDRRLAVVTNKPYRYTRKLLEELDLTAYFASVVGGDTVARTKPDPAPVRHALQELRCSPGEALMVGDSINDILSGREAGCRTAAVTYGFSRREDLDLARPDVIVDNLGELVSDP